jgi:hypothetical protein
MDERIDQALRAFRESTENARLPPGLADAVVRSAEAPTVVDAIASIGRRSAPWAAVVLAVLALVAIGSLRSLEQRAADYALSRGPS